MFKGNGKQGARFHIRPGEKIAAEQGEQNGYWVEVNNVSKSKGYSAEMDKISFLTGNMSVTVKKKCTVNELLRIDRKQWIDDHQRQPEREMLSEAVKKLPRKKNVDYADQCQAYAQKLFHHSGHVLEPVRLVGEDFVTEIIVAIKHDPAE